MHPDLEKLIALQQVDGEVARLREEIAALPRRVAAIEAKLAGTRTEIEKAQQGLAVHQAARRKLETEIQDHRGKISKYREQSLAVKTNEQYKALLHEIEFAEQQIRACEDKILEGMVDSEAREAALKAAEAELKAETAEIEKEKTEARALTAEDERQLAELNARREGLRVGVAPDVLAHYDRVLRARKTAVAEARAQKCVACNVLLRPQTYNDVKSNQQIMTCDSCSRILFYDPAHEAAPEVPARRRSTKKTEEEAAETEASVLEAGSSSSS
ncbi:MAG: C4-type zinc ribbon domain-containing protein [Acidobacteriota bacterium]|nr:C4-type zinc ribbon domain-containing protein [Acidobacteriota bacterium]